VVAGEVLYLCLWAAFTLLCFVVTLRKSHAPIFVTFCLLAAGG
jgi:succinate-acetate transporter protein